MQSKPIISALNMLRMSIYSVTFDGMNRDGKNGSVKARCKTDWFLVLGWCQIIFNVSENVKKHNAISMKSPLPLRIAKMEAFSLLCIIINVYLNRIIEQFE